MYMTRLQVDMCQTQTITTAQTTTTNAVPKELNWTKMRRNSTKHGLMLILMPPR